MLYIIIIIILILMNLCSGGETIDISLIMCLCCLYNALSLLFNAKTNTSDIVEESSEWESSKSESIPPAEPEAIPPAEPKAIPPAEPEAELRADLQAESLRCDE